jgi:hypothetical protein
METMFYFRIQSRMKMTIFLTIMFPLVSMSFIASYCYEATLLYWQEYFALSMAIGLDGFFGMINGIKKEGFKSFKALRIGKSFFSWNLILTSILITQKAFPAASWLDETFIIPVISFLLISTIKNASQAGFIKAELVNVIMEKIDQHKN